VAILTTLRREVDFASLAVVRVGVGLALAIEVVRFFTNGWIAGLYGPGLFHFHYLYLDWVQPMPVPVMHGLFGLMGLSALSLAAGWHARLCSGFLALGWGYVFLIDQTNYLNHLYMVVLVLVLLAAIPVSRGRVPGWGVWLLRFQVGVVYFFGGLAKLNADWMSGEPMTQWMALRSEMPLVGAWLTAPEVGLGLSWAGLGFDLLIVPLLLWRRTRLFGFVLVVAFHSVNAVLFHIGIFPWLMIALTTIYFAPSWPRRWARREAVGPSEGMAPFSLVCRVAIGSWVICQLGLPLRHWAYPGDVAWTEEGHRFAWRMKVRSKKGRVFFHVLDTATGERTKVDPCEELPLRQCRKMSTRPDMILQYAHHLRDEAWAQGLDVAVHVDAIGRLNQRRPQRLIDAEKNLAEVEPGLAPAPWIKALMPRTQRD